MSGSSKQQEASKKVLPRRELLKGSAYLGGGAAAALWGVGAGLAGPSQGMPEWQGSMQSASPMASPLASPEAVDNYQPVALNAAEAATLRAVGNRLIPADDLGPGAGDLGAFIYVDWALSGQAAATLPLYQGGLAALDAAAGSGGFVGADAATQDSLLSQAESGNLANAPQGFFALVLEHTRQGTFGDPMYGGNLGFAGWDLIQYPGLKLTWTAEEQALDTVVTPAHRSVAEQGGVRYVTPAEIVPTGTPVAGSGTPVVTSGGTPHDANA